MVTSAILNAVVMYAIAGVISMLVALLIKGLFAFVRHLNRERKP